MIGVIPNPKKSFQIDKSINEIYLAIEHLPLFSQKYKIFKSNKTLNLFTFEATELLSLGVYIDINCSSLTESKTEITIEVRRKVGTFNQSHEVTLANTHIVKITDLIAESVGTDEQERILKAEKIVTNKKEKEDELKQKIEENKRRNEEERQNNPVAYYAKQIIILAISFGMVGGTIYLLVKTFSK
jgi:hypothetical protein